MNSSPNIQVGILKKEQIQFKLAGKFNISGSLENCYNQCIAKIDNDKITLINNEGTLIFKKEVTFIPCNISADHFELNDVTIGIDFHWEQKENQKFQGALKLLIVENEIQVINILPIENYLISVISSEMNANSSLNLLKAHAIISRSWLKAQMQKQTDINKSEQNYNPIHKTESEYIRWYDREDHSHFNVCADDHCQRYQGITKAHKQNVIKAVHETRGEVLMYDNNICDARFSKSCGGVLELFENCWEPVKHPYLAKVIDNDKPPKGFELDLTNEENAVAFINGNPDAFCNTEDENILKQILNNYDLSKNGLYRWSVEYSQTELSKLIKKKSGIDFGEIIDLIPIERGESARLIKLKIVGKNKTLTIGKELEIRRWLSESHLYSSAITIEKIGIENDTPAKFIFRGAGWGHGVGLCQIGAAVMGEKGYDYKEILMHYYKNASIEKIY